MPLPFRRPQACLAMLLLWGAATAQAQSLRQLYEAALGYDATYQSALASARASQARADQARAGLLPQVGMQAGAQHNWSETSVLGGSSSRAFNTLNAALVGSQPLYRPANRIALNQGQRAAEAAQINLAGAEQDLIVRLAQAYFDVLAAQDTLASVRALKAAVNEQLQAARRNFEVGTTTITDTREAQSRADLATAQEIAAENALLNRRIALAYLVGRRDVEPLPLATPVVLPAVEPHNVEEWVSVADTVHPQVTRARVALELARLEIDKAKAGELPTLDAVATIGANHASGSSNQIIPGTTRTGSIGLELNWPLYTGGSVQNRIKETVSLEQRSREEFESARRTVAQNTRVAFFGVQSGEALVKALEAAESSSRLSLEATQLGYKVGVRVNIDVLNAQTQLFQTQRDLFKSRYDVLVNNLRLRQASGQLTPNDLLAVNSLLAKP